MQSLKNIWQVAIQRGISVDDSASRKTALRATNALLIGAVPAYLAYIFIGLVSIDYLFLAVALFAFCVHVSIYIAARYSPLGMFLRWLAIINANSMFVAFIYLLGKDSGMEYFFISMACIVFIAFDKEETFSTWFFVALSLFLYFYTEYFFTTSTAPSKVLIQVGAENLKIITFIIAFALCMMVVFFLKEYYTLAQTELDQEKALKIHESRLSAIGEMASVIIHEIKNPLGVLQGLNEVALEIIEDKNYNPVELTDLLQRSSKVTSRLNKLVRTLNVYTRKTEDDSFSMIELNKVFDEAFILFENSFHQHNITTEISLKTPDICIYGREIQLVQVFVNLMQNSFDSIKKQSTPWIKVEAEENNGKVKIRFTDSGLTKDLPKNTDLFKPFFTTKDIGKGTGLGLSVSKDILREHGGDIFIDSNEKNTTFVVVLDSKTQNARNTINTNGKPLFERGVG